MRDNNLDTHSTHLPKRRHCMVVHAYYPKAEIRVQREAHALQKYGYDVDVICLQLPQEADYEVVDGVHVYRVPLQRSKEWSFTAHLKEYLQFFFRVRGVFLRKAAHSPGDQFSPVSNGLCRNLPHGMLVHQLGKCGITLIPVGVKHSHHFRVARVPPGFQIGPPHEG